jgi:hypothetical protein
MPARIIVFFLFTLLCICPCEAQQQSSVGVLNNSAIEDVDTTFVLTFKKPNDVRLIYGTQGSSLEYGSKSESDPGIPTSLFNNVNDFVGLGITYKILDADMTFSLPQTRLMEEDRENLEQFRFSLSYTGRRYALRGLLANTNGVIVTDPLARFQSEADVHLFRICGQYTYIFNHQKYSYRAAMFQNELQRKTAGSFLFRLEPFYRGLGAGSGLVPSSRDNVQTYGDQTGLQYLYGAGCLAMPGYGVTITPFGERFYISPIVFAGPGIAFNFSQANGTDFTYTNWEWAGMLLLNIGYNGSKTYLNLNVTGDLNYSPLNPSYVTSSNLKIALTFGFRFMDLEDVIPSGF